ncbi:helix-turn-helix domain-containing protein [Crateriforma conspicua]|uniref:helix-turn-helix domain-containing protein n=1 Tax=Crateriforma conspicua TaxID=2527996 RepID=UPI0011A5F17F|nr:helix-turn-helix domain-containing protein [Crateriforma conspicua]
MPNVTQLRSFAKLLTQHGLAMWVLDEDDRIALATDAVGDRLRCDSDELIGVRVTSVGNDDPLSRCAAHLTPPPGRGDTGLLIVPWSGPECPNAAHGLVECAAFLSWPTEPGRSLTIGWIGPSDRFPQYPSQTHHPSWQASIELQRHLRIWMDEDRRIHDPIIAGDSDAIRRMRRQLEIAGRIRDDTLITAPAGFPSERLAQRLHQLSTPAGSDDANQPAIEPMETIDGGLMDLELLEAVAAPLISHLTGEGRPIATVVLRGLEETPPDVQQRVDQWKDLFGQRLRLIAILDRRHKASADVIEPLMQRLCGLVIDVPSLADRPDDVPMVATALLESRRSGGNIIAERFNRDGQDALVRYPWPGDIGELDDAVRFAAGIGSQTVLTREHLPLAVRSYRPPSAEADAMGDIDLDATLHQIERRLIEEAVAAADGNRSEAARRLGISRARLLRRLESQSDGDTGAPKSDDDLSTPSE